MKPKATDQRVAGSSPASHAKQKPQQNPHKGQYPRGIPLDSFLQILVACCVSLCHTMPVVDASNTHHKPHQGYEHEEISSRLFVASVHHQRRGSYGHYGFLVYQGLDHRIHDVVQNARRGERT
jgi:hypothetical protein